MITDENYPDFKKAYEKAVKDNQFTFEFEGQPVLTAWAKYVVEYAESLKTRK